MDSIRLFGKYVIPHFKKRAAANGQNQAQAGTAA
jgi:hypothetical protein